MEMNCRGKYPSRGDLFRIDWKSVEDVHVYCSFFSLHTSNPVDCFSKDRLVGYCQLHKRNSQMNGIDVFVLQMALTRKDNSKRSNHAKKTNSVLLKLIILEITESFTEKLKEKWPLSEIRRTRRKILVHNTCNYTDHRSTSSSKNYQRILRSTSSKFPTFESRNQIRKIMRKIRIANSQRNLPTVKAKLRILTYQVGLSMNFLQHQSSPKSSTVPG